ncbi:MAG: hypothetical protein PVH40_00640 [Gemmatimonadales bacterium]
MDPKKTFEPLKILGVFWSLFGVVILFATLFVRETPQVPLVRGIVTNLIAGALLLGAGVGSYLLGRARSRKEEQGS